MKFITKLKALGGIMIRALGFMFSLFMTFSAAASDDQKLGQSLCLSGFAESSLSWNLDFFLAKCKTVKTSSEGKCIEGFASSKRQWNPDDFLKLCKGVNAMPEAQCLFGFARSARNWNGKFFTEYCRKI